MSADRSASRMPIGAESFRGASRTRRDWPVPGGKATGPKSSQPTFRPLSVTPKYTLSTAALRPEQHPVLPPTVELTIRVIAACHHDAFPVEVLRATGTIVFDTSSPGDNEDASVSQLHERGTPIPADYTYAPKINPGESRELAWTFLAQVPCEDGAVGRYEIPKWATARDVVLVDSHHRKHPVGEVDCGPVLNGRPTDSQSSGTGGDLLI
jgi:hypothetical protein